MKVLKRIIITIVVLVSLVYFVAIPYIHSEAKKFSPAKSVILKLDKNNRQSITCGQIFLMDHT